MATNVDSNSGKCKVNVSVDCPCKLIIQGREYDAVPGDVFTIEPVVTSLPSAFFIEVKELSSVLTRVICLRSVVNARLNDIRKVSCSDDMTFKSGYLHCRENSLVQFIKWLDEIIEDYSL